MTDHLAGHLHLSGYELPENWKSLALYSTVLLYVSYGLLLALYRITLHPLASIPGPRLAGCTYWYEVYYEVFLGGKLFSHMADLHRRYGPVIRINPNELHFNDPEFIDSIYPGSSRKTNKPLFVGKRSQTPNSIIATVDHDVWRRRRNAINGFFSMASIRRLEPIVTQNTEKIILRLEQAARAGGDNQIIQMHDVFKAYASDVIITYAFGDCFHFLDEEDFGHAYFSSSDKYFSLTHVFAHFPFVATLVSICPAWITALFIPNLELIAEKQKWWLNRVRQIRSSPNPDDMKNTIFEGILASNLPAEEKTDTRMAQDAQLIVLAGEGTTAYTIQAALYELLAHPDAFKRAKEEVATVIHERGTVPSYKDVEQLVYFNAAIQETLRLHPGVLSRMPRTSPTVPIVYHDKRRDKTYTIPPGYPTGMSILIAHMNEDVFTNAYEFQPQRWIDNPRLDRYFIGFSRGSRNCVGMNLARREMCVVLATLLNEYDLYRGQEGKTLELYDTTRKRDIDPTSEIIVPSPAAGSCGLRVRVR